MARWEHSTSQGEEARVAQGGAAHEEQRPDALLPHQSGPQDRESVPLETLVADFYQQLRRRAVPLHEAASRRGMQIDMDIHVTVGSDIALVTSERFDSLPPGRVPADVDGQAEAVPVDARGEDGEDEAVDGREEAVQRARRSAAGAVIAANNRLGVVTPQEIRDVAGPDEDAGREERPGWWARRFGGAARSA
jgi:hypothetical protein